MGAPHASQANRSDQALGRREALVHLTRTCTHKPFPKLTVLTQAEKASPPLLSASQIARQNLPMISFWTRNSCLPTPGSHYLQTVDFLSLLLATGSNGKVDQSSKQMRYYILVPVPAAHNSGRTDHSNYDAFFIQSDESITSFACV